MVGYMRISIGEKQLQAERPRAMPNLRALDRHPHRLILGYAVDTLVKRTFLRIAGGGRF